MATGKIIKHGLSVVGIGNDDVLTVSGTNGVLFTITDDYSGVLHTISDISGVPVFKVEDDGVSTFTGPVFGVAPTVDLHLATKKYVDDNGGGGGSGTVTSVGTNAPLTGTVTTSGSLSITQATTSVDGYLSSTDWNTFNNKTSNSGTVTSVSGGTGLSSTGGTTPSISLDNTAVVAGTYTNADITVDAQGRLTAAATGSTGGTANNSTITLTAGTGLSGGNAFTTNQASNETITFNLDANSLGVGGTLLASDHLVASNGTASQKQLVSSIPLGVFNNDQGWTSNTGDITGVTAGNGITGGATSGTATVTLGTPTSVTGTSTNSVAASGHTHAVTTGAVTNGGTALADGNDIYDFVIGLGYTTNVGDITGVTAGTGLTGGGTSGTPTLNVIGGTGITANANDIALTNVGPGAGSYTNADITINAQGQITAAANGAAGGGGTMSSWTIMEGNGTESTTVTNGETFQIEQGTGIQSELTSTTGGGILTITNTAPNVVQTTITGNAGTATKLSNINTTFTGTYPMTVNVSGTIYSHTGVTFNGTSGFISASGFSSTVASGTAPFTVASNTVVTNLNADLLDGNTSGNFVRSNATDSISGAITHTGNYYRFNDSVELYFGTATSQSFIWSSGSHTYWTLTSGNLYVRDGSTVRFTFERTTGYFTAVKSFASSTRAIKKNIREYNNSALDIVNDMEIVQFDYKDGSGNDAVGIIAEDAPEEIVNDDRTSVDLYNLQFIQAKAIQELSDENTALRDKLEILEAKLNDLIG